MSKRTKCRARRRTPAPSLPTPGPAGSGSHPLPISTASRTTPEPAPSSSYNRRSEPPRPLGGSRRVSAGLGGSRRVSAGLGGSRRVSAGLGGSRRPSRPDARQGDGRGVVQWPSRTTPVGHRPSSTGGHPRHEHVPVPRPLRGQPPPTRRGPDPRGDPGRAAGHGQGGGRLLGDRKVLGDDVLRRPRPLPLPHRGVRALRPRQLAPARHVPELHEVRSRDHRHDPRPPPRRGDRGHHPAGLVTTGGTGSIAHAMLAYREHARQERGVTRPNVIKPETAHPAFDKACHLFGIELRRAPVDPDTTLVDVGWVDDHIDDQTVAIIGSACNYGYGTVDPDRRALGRGARPRRRPPRRRVPRWVHPALRAGARLRHPHSSTTACPG